MDSVHPPLSSTYLALWFTLAGWKPIVARIAMLLLAAFALTNVFLLARRVSKLGVAVAATVATATYPIFFVQSSLTHADLAAAAFTLWGVRLGIERRLWWSQLALSLAVLSKETAIITPAALALWEIFFAKTDDGNSAAARLERAAIRLVPVVPLAAWLVFHYHVTGHIFGDTAFTRYNVTQTLNPLRFFLALALRAWHMFGIMSMLPLTAAMIVAMFFPPVVDKSGERPRIAIPLQIQFALIILAHLVTFSIVGGAALTRYLLPVYPLVIIVAMSTLHRRILRWEWPAAIMVIFLGLALNLTKIVGLQVRQIAFSLFASLVNLVALASQPFDVV